MRQRLNSPMFTTIILHQLCEIWDKHPEMSDLSATPDTALMLTSTDTTDTSANINTPPPKTGKHQHDLGSVSRWSWIPLYWHHIESGMNTAKSEPYMNPQWWLMEPQHSLELRAASSCKTPSPPDVLLFLMSAKVRVNLQVTMITSDMLRGKLRMDNTDISLIQPSIVCSP